MPLNFYYFTLGGDLYKFSTSFESWLAGGVDNH